MSYDLKATILSVTSSVSGGGSVDPVFASIGTVYLERVRVTAQSVVASARDADQLENVFRARFHSELGKPLRALQIGSVVHRIVKTDEIARRKGWMIYTQTTP